MSWRARVVRGPLPAAAGADTAGADPHHADCADAAAVGPGRADLLTAAGDHTADRDPAAAGHTAAASHAAATATASTAPANDTAAWA